MEDTTGLLAAELNGLFERIGLILNEVETKLTPEQCTKFVQSLPAPSLLVFSRLLLMMGKRLQEQPIHIPTDKDNAALNCHHESPAAVNNHREDLCPPGDRGENAAPINDNDTPNEAFHSDYGGTVEHHQSHRKSSNPDQRIDLYRPLSISTSLHNALIKHQGNPQSFLKSSHHIEAQAPGGLTGAFFRLHQKCDDIQDEKTRDIYLQMYLLYRRLEFRNLFLLAKGLGYHTGDRWRRDACPQLAAQIKQKHPSLAADELLEEYVRLGRAYNRWAEELGGPGYLLILPLTVTEYQYTGREFSRYFSSAVDSLRENGIDNAVTSNGLGVLGKKIADELWASSQETEGSLKRRPTKSALRNKRKRGAKVQEINQNEGKRRKMPQQEFRNTRSPGVGHLHRTDPRNNFAPLLNTASQVPTADLGSNVIPRPPGSSNALSISIAVSQLDGRNTSTESAMELPQPEPVDAYTKQNTSIQVPHSDTNRGTNPSSAPEQAALQGLSRGDSSRPRDTFLENDSQGLLEALPGQRVHVPCQILSLEPRLDEPISQSENLESSAAWFSTYSLEGSIAQAENIDLSNAWFSTYSNSRPDETGAQGGTVGTGEAWFTTYSNPQIQNSAAQNDDFELSNAWFSICPNSQLGEPARTLS